MRPQITFRLRLVVHFQNVNGNHSGMGIGKNHLTKQTRQNQLGITWHNNSMMSLWNGGSLLFYPTLVSLRESRYLLLSAWFEALEDVATSFGSWQPLSLLIPEWECSYQHVRKNDHLWKKNHSQRLPFWNGTNLMECFDQPNETRMIPSSHWGMWQPNATLGLPS